MSDEEILDAIRCSYPKSSRDAAVFEKRLDLFRQLGSLNGKIYDSDLLGFILEQGDLEVLKILLERGMDATVQDRNDETYLHYLARCKVEVPKGTILDCARLLADAGASPMRKNSDGQTAVYIAAEKGRYELIEALVEKGKKINLTNNNGETPLFPACSYANSTAESFFKYDKPKYDKFMAEPDAVGDDNIRRQQEDRARKKEEYDQSKAKVDNYYMTVKLLIQGGVDPDQKNNYEKTAKEVAFECMDLRIPALLNGMDTDSGGDGAQWELKAKGMNLPQAIVKKDHEAVEALLELGNDPNGLCDPDGHMEGVDCKGKTPLGIAGSISDDKSIKLLLKYGANPNEKDTRGKTPIAYCLDRFTGENVLEDMQKAGLDINDSVDSEGNTMLHMVCENMGNDADASKKFLKPLMRMKPDHDKTNGKGVTPLMLVCKASSTGAEDAQITLLEAGANVGAKDSSGNTPLMYAASNKERARAKSMAEMLFEFGDPLLDAVNNAKQSALDIAGTTNNEPLINYLLTKM